MSYREVAEATFGECLGESGNEARFLCPHHDDRVGKLYTNTDTGMWLCFSGSCGAKGRLGTLSVDDEISALRRRLTKLTEGDNDEARIYPEAWLRQFQQGHPYWTTIRKFSPKTVQRFNLGYDPATDKLTIPLRDSHGEVLGVVRRALDGSRPKYAHPVGFRSGKHLYGSHLVGERTKVALVEGPLDAVACWDARVPALACHGARLTEGQAWLLRYIGVGTVVAMFDNDHAGRMATEGLREVIPDLIVQRAEWRWSAKDPGELRPDQRRMFFHEAK
jgi:DNA primase